MVHKKKKEGEIKRHVFVVLFIGFSGTTLRFCYGNESRPTANSPLVLPRRWLSTASAQKHINVIQRFPLWTAIHNLEAGPGHPQTLEGTHPPKCSVRLFFSRWFLNDYICSLKSRVVTSFGVRMIWVTLLEILSFTSCSKTSLPGPSSLHQSYSLKTQMTHVN